MHQSTSLFVILHQPLLLSRGIDVVVCSLLLMGFFQTGTFVRGYLVGGFTPFFRLSVILPSRVPNTIEEFVAATMAIEDLTFVQNLLRFRSLVSMVASGQDNILGFGNLARKRGKLKEKC